MHPDKIKNIIKLNIQDRFEYTIGEIVKHEGLWCIQKDDGIATYIDSEGDEVFPIWPHKEAAELCPFEQFSGDEYYHGFVDMDELWEYILPDFDEKNILIGVFFVKDQDAMCVPSAVLAEELLDEMDSD